MLPPFTVSTAPVSGLIVGDVTESTVTVSWTAYRCEDWNTASLLWLVYHNHIETKQLVVLLETSEFSLVFHFVSYGSSRYRRPGTAILKSLRSCISVYLSGPLIDAQMQTFVRVSYDVT